MSFLTRFCRFVYAPLALLILSMSSALLQGQAPVTSSQIAAQVSSNGKTASTTFLSAPVFMLRDVPSSVTATDLDGDGKPDLIVASSTTGKVSVYLGLGKGKFAAPTEYSVGGHPSAIIAADIDGDGTKDIVTANGTDGTISVLLAIAGGKLAGSRVYPVGVDADLLLAADLNGDGKQDIVVGSKAAKAIATLLNDGQGTLQKPSIQALGKIPDALATGDFNGDGHADVIVANSDGTADALLGGGNGSLAMSVSLKASSTSLSYVVTGDFNGDGKPDLAVTEVGGHTLMIFAGNGDGTFSQGKSYRVGNKPSSLIAVDVNGDGLIDLVSSNQGSNTLSVLLGKADGSFQEAMDFTVGDGPVSLAAADFYGDGYIGLAVINSSAKTLNVIAGKGDGSFRAAPSYSGDLSPRAIASGDFNGDGLPDVVVTNFCGSDAQCGKTGSITVYLAQKSGGYRSGSTQAIGAGPVAVALVDLNGDGILDAVALNRTDKSLSVLLGVGDGTLQAPSTFPLANSPVALVARDFDKDGNVDIAVLSDCGSPSCPQPGSVDTYFGLGDGTFRIGASAPVGYSPASIAAGDLNGDGALDLVIANTCGKDATCNSAGTATVLFGDLKGLFHPQPDIALNNAPASIALRSASSTSTALDLVVSYTAGSSLAVLAGNGDGTFKTPSAYTVGNSPRSIVLADLNGDGIPDVAVANARDSTVSVLYGKADGTLVAGQSYAVAAGPEALTAISGTAGAPASLVTANGNSSSSPLGSEITSLVNAGPNAGTTTSSTSLAITATNPAVNGSVTLTATITPTPSDGDTVTFSSDDVGNLTDCINPATTTSGIASCTTSQLTAGSRTITATFAGDATYAISSDQQTQSIATAGANLSLAPPTGTFTVNQPITFVATLSPASGTFSPTPPSGMIAFTITGQSGATCPSVTLSATITSASCVITANAVENLSIVANYSGDNNFTVGNNGNSTQQTAAITAIPATLTVMSSSLSSTVNQPVTFTATLAVPAGSSFSPTAPSSMISFMANGQAIPGCSAMAPSASASPTAMTAACTTSSIPAGSYSVLASYTGDPNYTVSPGGSSPSITQTVTSIAATLMVTSSPTAPTVNQQVTFTATLGAGSSPITPIPPAGTISFTVTGQSGATCGSTTVSATVMMATCIVTANAVETLSVVANYSNDSNYTVGTSGNSAPQTAAITAIPATLTVMSSSLSSTVNQPVTFTATLAVPAGSSFSPTAPSSMISFMANGQAIPGCSAMAPSASASPTAMTAACTTSSIPAGSYSVLASYTGDPNYTVSPGGSSPSITQTVGKIAATLALAGPMAATTVNQPVTFNATFSTGSAAITPIAPNGTISFTVTGAIATNCGSTHVTTANATAPCMVTPTAVGTLSVTASYTDDNYSAPTTAPPVTQTISAISATLTLAGPATAMTVNQAVTFSASFSTGTATITPTGPNGMITFAINLNGQPITSCASTSVMAANVTAMCSVTPAAAGLLTVTASYTDINSNYTVAGTTPSSLTQMVNKITPTFSLAFSSTPSPAAVNQTVTYTATVVSPAPGSTLPSGNVTFTQAGMSVCGLVGLIPSTTSPTTSSTATCNIAFSSPGTSSAVTATYNGDSNFNAPSASTATAPTFSVIAGGTATTLASTGYINNPVVNQNVTFTATIKPTYTGTAMLSGTVTFTDQTSGSALCTNVQVTVSNSIGSAVCTMPLLSQGSHNILAAYTSADLSSFTSSNGTLTQMVGAESSSTTLSPLNPATVNTPVTLMATVTKADPTFPGTSTPQGTVNFTEGGTTVGTCGAAVITSGAAMCSVPFATAGTHNITATYVPSPTLPMNFAASSSTAIPVVITKGSTVVSVSSDPPSSTVNQSVVFTATVTSTPAGTAKPNQAVTFVDTSNGSSCTSTSTVLATGTAMCSFTFLTSGTHTIQATYPGDDNFTGNTGMDSQTVGATTTMVTLTTAQTTAAVDQPVTINTTLTSTQPGSVVPSGMVTITDAAAGASTVTQCTLTVTSNGATPPLPVVPACSINFTGPVSHTLIATFTPTGSSFEQSVSSPLIISVTKAPTAVALATSPAAPLVNQPITFTGTVSLPSPSVINMPTPPGGTISFFNGSTLLCTTLPGALGTTATASCSALLGAANTYPAITATYSGDTNFVSSTTTTAVSETVSPGMTSIALTAAQSTLAATTSGAYTAVLTVSSPAVDGTGTALRAVPLAGTLTFTAGGGATVPGSCTASSASIASGAIYNCTIAFPVTAGGNIPVTATFTPSTGNFVQTSTTVQQPVQNFMLATLNRTPATPATVYVTQGMSNTSDLLFPSTLGAVVTATASGFTDSVKYTCSLPAAATGLSCATNPPSASNTPTVTVTATSAATPGIYTATLTATAVTTPALLHTTSFTVQVNSVVSSINLTAGATGSLQVPFPGGLAVTTGTNYCLNYIVNGVQMPTSAVGVGITCTASSNQTSNGNLSFTVSTTSANTASVVPHFTSRISLAALLGVPLFLLGTWKRRRASFRSNWVRSLGVLSLLISLSIIIGCGGGFTTSPQKLSSATAAGTYQLEVIVADSSGVNYYAIIPLVVN